MWYTKLGHNDVESVMFKQLPDITPVNGQITLQLGLNEVYTITTTTGQKKGSYPDPPKPGPFPSHYKDTFDGYPVNSEVRE